MIENIRRKAYVDAIYKSREVPVVSFFGQVPWEVIQAFDVLPIRSYGIDYYVVEEEHDMCAMLNSTVEYARRDKCPFMHVSSYFIVDQYCPFRTAVIQEYFDPVYLYDSVEDLILFMEMEYGKRFDEEKFMTITEKSARISELMVGIQQSDLPAKDINLYQYYTQFIFDLDERIDYLEKIDCRPAQSSLEVVELGQIAGIDHHFSDQVILEGAYCEGERHLVTDARGFDFIEEKYCYSRDQEPDYNVSGCQLFLKKQVNYKGED